VAGKKFIAGEPMNPATNRLAGPAVQLLRRAHLLATPASSTTQEVHDLLGQHPKPNNVIVGVRPEHLENAALIDTYARIRALTFEVKVDFVESLGADKYVHFKSEGAGAQQRSWPSLPRLRRR